MRNPRIPALKIVFLYTHHTKIWYNVYQRITKIFNGWNILKRSGRASFWCEKSLCLFNNHEASIKYHIRIQHPQSSWTLPVGCERDSHHRLNSMIHNHWWNIFDGLQPQLLVVSNVFAGYIHCLFIIRDSYLCFHHFDFSKILDGQNPR